MTGYEVYRERFSLVQYETKRLRVVPPGDKVILSYTWRYTDDQSRFWYAVNYYDIDISDDGRELTFLTQSAWPATHLEITLIVADPEPAAAEPEPEPEPEPVPAE